MWICHRFLSIFTNFDKSFFMWSLNIFGWSIQGSGNLILLHGLNLISVAHDLLMCRLIFPLLPRVSWKLWIQLTLLWLFLSSPYNRAWFYHCVCWFIKSIRSCSGITFHLFYVILSGFLMPAMPAGSINFEWLSTSS